MYVTGKPASFDSSSALPPRAGLRVAPVPGRPTGIFEVVELAVLVLVMALAMVSIIVAGGEDDRLQARGSNGGAEPRPGAHAPARPEATPTYASVEAHRPADLAASR